MPNRAAPPDLLSRVLPTVMQRVDPERQLRAYAVWKCWEEEVGEAIARRAQPARFRNGILFVTVASHTWMQELQFMKGTIVERLNVRLGETDPPLIRDMFFVSGAISKAAPVPLAPPDTVQDEPRVPLLPSSGDAELDAALARIMRARARRRPTRGR